MDQHDATASEASDTMSNTTAEINSFAEQARRLGAPLLKANEISAKAFERVARHQYELAGDLLNLGIAQLNAATQAKDVPALLQKQAELAHTYFEKQTQRSQDLLRIASESQAELTSFIDGATAEFTQRVNGKATA
jgi:phasin family protein